MDHFHPRPRQKSVYHAACSRSDDRGLGCPVAYMVISVAPIDIYVLYTRTRYTRVHFLFFECLRIYEKAKFVS